jgi:hypothetical protein
MMTFAKPSGLNRPFALPRSSGAAHAPFFKQKSLHSGVFSTQLAIIFIAIAGFVPSAQAAEPTLSYTVQAKDKLIVLANEMLTGPKAWSEVASLNKLPNPDRIRAGQTISIPLRLLRSTEANAKLVSVQGDVRVGGQTAAVGQSVPVGAQLQTGANSSAVLELPDASRVQVLPATLTELSTSRHYAMRESGSSGTTNWYSGVIRLVQGALETFATPGAKRATPLQVQTPTSLVGVRGTQFRVAFEDPANKNARTEVITGLVRADNSAQGSGADLPKGTGAVINPAVREVKVVNLLAAPDEAQLRTDVTRSTGSSGPALWPLPALAGASAYRVQVASDAQFNQLVRDLRIAAAPAGQAADLSSLPNGNWHARVRGVDGVGLEGFNAVKLVRLADGRVSLIWPGQIAVDATARFVDGATQLQIQRAPDAPQQLTAVLASDAGMAQVLKREPFNTNSLSLGNLSPGQRVYLQFEGIGLGNQSAKSDVLLLEIPANWGTTVTTVAGALQKLR